MIKEKIITAVVSLIALGILATLGVMVYQAPVVGVVLVGMMGIVGLIIAGAQYAK